MPPAEPADPEPSPSAGPASESDGMEHAFEAYGLKLAISAASVIGVLLLGWLIAFALTAGDDSGPPPAPPGSSTPVTP